MPRCPALVKRASNHISWKSTPPPRSEMLLSSLAVLIAALPLAVFGGEFPIYDGVIGGTPPDLLVGQDFSQEVLGTPTGDVVTQDGGLRYVENSGVCGRSSLLNLLPVRMLILGQKRPPACTQLQAMQTSLPHSTCGSGSLRRATTPTLHR